MSSKRLLDFLILASTVKQILKQHIRLRADNLSLYSQTSSLTKPLRDRRVAQGAAPQPRCQRVKAQAEVQLDAQQGTREGWQPQVQEENGRAAGERERILDAPTAKVPTTATATASATAIPPVDSELFILRSARGNSPILSRLRRHQKAGEGERAPKLEPTQGKEEGNGRDQHPQALCLDTQLSDSSGGSPSTAVLGEPPSISAAPMPAVIDATEASISTSTEPTYMQALPPDEASTITTTPSPTRADTPEPYPPSPPPPPPPPAAHTITPTELDFTTQSLATGTPTTESVRPLPHLFSHPKTNTNQPYPII